MKDKLARNELLRIKLRLFGINRTDCLNVGFRDKEGEDSVLGGLTFRIVKLEDVVTKYGDRITELENKIKEMSSKKRKKKK